MCVEGKLFLTAAFSLTGPHRWTQITRSQHSAYLREKPFRGGGAHAHVHEHSFTQTQRGSQSAEAGPEELATIHTFQTYQRKDDSALPDNDPLFSTQIMKSFSQIPITTSTL